MGKFFNIYFFTFAFYEYVSIFIYSFRSSVLLLNHKLNDQRNYQIIQHDCVPAVVLISLEMCVRCQICESCPVIISVFLIKSKVDRRPLTNPIPERKIHRVMSRIFLCFFDFHRFGPRDVTLSGRFNSVLRPASKQFGAVGETSIPWRKTLNVLRAFLNFPNARGAPLVPLSISRTEPRHQSASRRYQSLVLTCQRDSFETSLYLPVSDWIGFSCVSIDLPCVLLGSVSHGVLCLSVDLRHVSLRFQITVFTSRQGLKIGTLLAYCYSFVFLIFRWISVRERKTGCVPDQAMGSKRYVWLIFLTSST